MGDEARKDPKIKNMTSSEVAALVNATMQDFLERNLASVVDEMVKERIAEYHAICVRRGLFLPGGAAPAAQPPQGRIHLPVGVQR